MRKIPAQSRVAAVIPTIGRKELFRALKSVTSQTTNVAEIFVVADTEDEIDLHDFPEVQLLRCGPGAGGNVARMMGARAATSEYIAFLDDDDWWEPAKTERQLNAVAERTDKRWICSTYTYNSQHDSWPKYSIPQGSKIVDYLFRKTGLRNAQGAVPTPTILAPRELLLEIPLDTSLKFHQDTEWMVRLDENQIQLIQVEEPLVGTADESPESTSGKISAAQSLAFMRQKMKSVSLRTKGDFILTVPYFYAWRRMSVRAAAQCVVAALREGKPSRWALLTIATMPSKIIVLRLVGRARTLRARIPFSVKSNSALEPNATV